MVADSLEDLAYRDLQAECKKFGISAKGTRAELVARLLENNGRVGDEVPATTPRTARKPVRAAKTPGTSKTPAAAKPGKEEQPQSPAAATARKAPGSVVLLQAAKTPLPKTPPKEGGLQPPPPAARKAQTRRSAPLSLGSVLALAAVCAAVSALAIPAWQHYGCGATLHQHFPGAMQQADQFVAAAHDVAARLSSRAGAVMPNSLLAGARQYFEAGRSFPQHHWQNAQRQCTYLWNSAQQWAADVLKSTPAPAGSGSEAAETGPSIEPAAPSCSGLLQTETLGSIVPPGSLWDNLKQTAAAAWEGQRVDPTKPSTMLFACIETNCPIINDWLAWSVPEEACLLRLQAGELGEDRGALQKALATFIAQRPKGTVLITDFDKLSPLLMPVLINALSEQGAFEQDGVSVLTRGATFLLSMPMPREILDAESEATFKVNAKAHLVHTLTEQAASAEAALSHAKALRRRIEYVLPTVY